MSAAHRLRLTSTGTTRRAEILERLAELSGNIGQAEDEIDGWEAEREELERVLATLEAKELDEREACRRDPRQIALPLRRA